MQSRRRGKSMRGATHGRTSGSSRKLAHSPYKRPGATDYRHIQTAAPPNQEGDHESEAVDKEDSFIRRLSLQDELEQIDSEASIEKSAIDTTITPAEYEQPTSFAEVVAMPRSHRLRNSIDASGEAPDSTSSTTSQLSPLKHTIKLPSNRRKHRKWAPLQFTDGEFSDETSGAGASTPPVSPKTLAFSPADSQNFTSRSVSFPPLSSPIKVSSQRPTNQENIGEPSDYSEQHTPTQVSSNAFHTQATVFQTPRHIERSLIHQGDSPSTKNKLQNIMSRIDDVFDVEEWNTPKSLDDPENPSNSPKPLSAKPEPVTYTTVGSLVKSNATPQFTAPVRIQREGSCRRPLPTPAQTRGHDSYLGLRGMNNQVDVGFKSPLSLQQSTNYAQQRFPDRNIHILTDLEKEVLLQSLGVSSPVAPKENIPRTQQTAMLDFDPFTAEFSNQQGYPREDLPSQAVPSSTSLLALDKMQTLQRLSQFPNPMQKLAKERLSEFNVARSHSSGKTTPTATTKRSLASSYTRPTLSFEGSAPADMDLEKQEKGVLDYGYKFPPPGLAVSNVKQSVSINALSSTSSYGGPGELTNRQSLVNNLVQPRPGCPLPLTAGPPGQKQATYREAGAPGHDIRKTTLQVIGGRFEGLNSPWAAHNPQNMFTSTPVAGSHIKDTLSPEQAAKYYPRGPPRDLGREFVDVRWDFGAIGGPVKTSAESEKRQNQDEWWYSGVRKFNMTPEEHLRELEKREVRRLYGYYPYPEQPLKPISEYQTFTAEQIKNMSDAECGKPLMDGLFGTMLGYADNNITPDNKSIMSKFATSLAWCIDQSESGRKSFFGEDWGPASKRLGRDPRYQSRME